MSAATGSDPLPLAAVLARWDAVVIRWGLDPEERTALLGCGRGGSVAAVETYGSVDAEARMRLMVDLEALLAQLHGDEFRVRAWLRAPNPSLGDRTPLGVLSGSPQWARWLIDNFGVAL